MINNIQYIFNIAVFSYLKSNKHHFSVADVQDLFNKKCSKYFDNFFLFFISFAIPKYNNYNYYHKAYMHKLTTHLSTRAIPQLPHKVMPTVILQVLFKKEETILIIFFKRRKST